MALPVLNYGLHQHPHSLPQHSLVTNGHDHFKTNINQVQSINVPPRRHCTLRNFSGKDGSLQDPCEFLENIRYLTDNYSPDIQHIEQASRILFRTHLEGQALRWYNHQLPQTRASWQRLQFAFLKTFRQPDAINADVLPPAISTLKQSAIQSDREYCNQAEEIFYEIPVEHHQNLAVQFINGIYLASERKRVSNALGQSPTLTNPSDFTFCQALKAMKEVSGAFLSEDEQS